MAEDYFTVKSPPQTNTQPNSGLTGICMSAFCVLATLALGITILVLEMLGKSSVFTHASGQLTFIGKITLGCATLALIPLGILLGYFVKCYGEKGKESRLTPLPLCGDL